MPFTPSVIQPQRIHAFFKTGTAGTGIRQDSKLKAAQHRIAIRSNGQVYSLQNRSNSTRKLSIMNTKQQRKIIQIKTRITEAQHVDFVCQAQNAGMTLSELIRQRIVNKLVIARADTCYRLTSVYGMQ